MNRGAGAGGWQPTRIDRYIKSIESSTRVARVRTDQGDAFIKALGNPEGPHALAREFIGTALAQWFGLPTFEFAVIDHDGLIDIPLGSGDAMALPGPVFATRAHAGRPWHGTAADLKRVENTGIITSLVVFDTWVRNRDRCAPTNLNRKPNRDNVFLSEDGASAGTFRLIAMDHTHCLADGAEITPSVKNIANVQDEGVYGLFDEFRPYLNKGAFETAMQRLEMAKGAMLLELVPELPAEWDIANELRQVIFDFLVRRAEFLVEHLPEPLRPILELNT